VSLDVLVVCKLGVPFQPELAFGAVGEGPSFITAAKYFELREKKESE
jgi:predicted phosphoribosyltransferase